MMEILPLLSAIGENLNGMPPSLATINLSLRAPLFAGGDPLHGRDWIF